MQTTRYSWRESALWASGIMAYGVVAPFLFTYLMHEGVYIGIGLPLGFVLLILWQLTNCRHRLTGKLMLIAGAALPLCFILAFLGSVVRAF